ncbi:MAG: GNAT family N-acetyltransferase [Candidatus Baltobacteraceae bacterium]
MPHLRWRGRLIDVPFNVIAELESVRAGIVSATAPSDDRTVELISLWVAPFARGCGLGDALVSAVIAWAREQTAARVMLAVTPANGHAIALYRRHGFVEDARVDNERTMIRAL